MYSRRELAGLIGVGAAAAAVNLSSAGGANAQPASSAPGAFDRIRSNGKLRMGAVANAGLPFFSKNQETGTWGGLFWDLGTALASDMEVELELVETTWANAVLDLQSDKIDVMFGLNPYPKRALAITFSDWVFQTAFVMIARGGVEFQTWEEMNKPSIKLSVAIGTHMDHIVTTLCPDAEIIRFRSNDESVLAIESGRADAVCLVWMEAMRVLGQKPEIGKMCVVEPICASSSNIGLRRESDQTLRDFVNTWILYSRGMGVVRKAVISNLAKIGVVLEDRPQGIEF